MWIKNILLLEKSIYLKLCVTKYYELMIIRQVISQIGYLNDLLEDYVLSHLYGLHLFFCNLASHHQNEVSSYLRSLGRNLAAFCSILLLSSSFILQVFSFLTHHLVHFYHPARYCSGCGTFEFELSFKKRVLDGLGFSSSPHPNDQLDWPPGWWCTLTLVFWV